jgi:hypothetical protein
MTELKFADGLKFESMPKLEDMAKFEAMPGFAGLDLAKRTMEARVLCGGQKPQRFSGTGAGEAGREKLAGIPGPGGHRLNAQSVFSLDRGIGSQNSPLGSTHPFRGCRPAGAHITRSAITMIIIAHIMITGIA